MTESRPKMVLLDNICSAVHNVLTKMMMTQAFQLHFLTSIYIYIYILNFGFSLKFVLKIFLFCVFFLIMCTVFCYNFIGNF